MDANLELAPLKITCKSTRCDDNLHCFQLTKKQLLEGPAGRCRSCGVELVDWPRVHRCQIDDAAHTIESMKLELIRHHFWHLPISEYAENYARRKGKEGLPAAIRHRLEVSIGKSFHPMQGRQTPFNTSPTANVVHYAQHATATCCRACVAEWHGISPDRDITPQELDYLTELVMIYVLDKIPDLDKNAQKVARPRQREVQLENRELSHAH